MTTSTAPTATAPQITFPIEAQAGSVTIAVHRIPGGYSLLTTALGQDLSDWCEQFGSLKTAAAEASRVLAAFEQHGTAKAIDDHAGTLRRYLREQDSRPAAMRDNARIGATYTELAQLEDFGTKRVRARFAAQFAVAA